MPRDRAFLGFLALWTLLCAALGATRLVDLESVPLFLALHHQDLRLHQPHPPGFILHVWLAQVLQACGAAPFLSLRLASWLSLAAAGALLFRTAQLRHPTGTARWAVVLFFSSPLVLFHGMTVGTYADEALVASAAAFLCLRCVDRGSSSLRLEAYLLGLLTGLRPTTVVFTVPLLLWTGRRVGLRAGPSASAGLAWFLGMLCWLVPQIDLAGGFGDYLAANKLLLVPLLHHTPLVRGPLGWIENCATPITALLFGLGACRLLSSLVVAQGAVRLERGFVLAWVLPVVLLGTILGFRHTGAVLGLWPLVCMALASAWSTARSLRTWRSAVLLGAVGLDLAGFFFLPASTWSREAHIGSETSKAAASSDGSESPSIESAPQVEAHDESRPRGLQQVAARLLAQVDFDYGATRRAPFDDFLEALEAAPFPAGETLLLGSRAARAACVRFPMRSIVQGDPLRPAPFLLYRELRPTVLDSTFVVPRDVTWLLLEGDASQLDFAPPSSENQQPMRPVRLARQLQAYPIRRQGLDVWFTPRGSTSSAAPWRLHLWREGQLDDPALFERASGAERRGGRAKPLSSEFDAETE